MSFGTVDYFLGLFRCNGWSVAVHNDYRLNGESMTFYLLTHPRGIYAKGEGKTDLEALQAAHKEAIARQAEFLS